MAVDHAVDPRGRDVDVAGDMYLIHFRRPFKHAKHYFGFSTDLPNRLECHRKGYAGHAAVLMREVHLAGIPWDVVAVWPGTRRMEAHVKSWGSLARICPVCTGNPVQALPARLDRAGSKQVNPAMKPAWKMRPVAQPVAVAAPDPVDQANPW